MTTHTESLARPQELNELLFAQIVGQDVEPAAFDAVCCNAVVSVVKQQDDIGIAVLNDGDQSKTGFTAYVRERLHGFEGASGPRTLRGRLKSLRGLCKIGT